MSIQTPKYAEYLEHWLRFDTWGVDEAIRLMAGLDPADDDFDVCLDRSIPPWEFDNREAKKKYDRLWEIWRSGWRADLHEQEHNPPDYYIDWASRKRIDIPWLSWAEEKGYIKASNSTHEKIVELQSGNIHPRTKNNYLRLIMALAMNSIAGFDPRKPHQAARAIKEATEVDLDEKAIAGYISEAFELQSKERDS